MDEIFVEHHKRVGSHRNLHVTNKEGDNQTNSAIISNFDALPTAAHVRLPVVKILYGCSSATIWRCVKSKLIPAPRRFATRVTAWNVGELRKSLENIK